MVLILCVVIPTNSRKIVGSHLRTGPDSLIYEGYDQLRTHTIRSNRFFVTSITFHIKNKKQYKYPSQVAQDSLLKLPQQNYQPKLVHIKQKTENHILSKHAIEARAKMYFFFFFVRCFMLCLSRLHQKMGKKGNISIKRDSGKYGRKNTKLFSLPFVQYTVSFPSIPFLPQIRKRKEYGPNRFQ